MPEILSFDGREVEYTPFQRLKDWYNSLDKFVKVSFFITAFLIFSTPIIISGYITLRQYASEKISFLEVQPAIAQNILLGQDMPMSALAYDAQSRPIWDNVTYEWTMSSVNSIGTFEKIVGKENIFKALKPGFVEITVTARIIGVDSAVSKTVPVHIGSDVMSSPVKIESIADAWVRKDMPTQNYGRSYYMRVDGNPLVTSYLKFDLSLLKARIIDKAVLNLTVSGQDNANSALAKGLEIKGVSDSFWKEYGITYNNKPSLNTTISTYKGSRKKGDILEIDITQYIRDHKGLLVSLNLSNSGSDSVTLNTREASSGKPSLIIYYH